MWHYFFLSHVKAQQERQSLRFQQHMQQMHIIVYLNLNFLLNIA